MKTLSLALVGLLFCVESFAAGIPTGSYSGSVSDGMSRSDRVYCMADHVEITIHDRGEGRYSIVWREDGRRQNDSMWCQRYLSAELKPRRNRAGEWDVSFLANSDLIFGRAKLTGDRLQIDGQYSGMTDVNFRATWVFGDANRSINYRRELRRVGSMTDDAVGFLTLHGTR